MTRKSPESLKGKLARLRKEPARGHGEAAGEPETIRAQQPLPVWLTANLARRQASGLAGGPRPTGPPLEGWTPRSGEPEGVERVIGAHGSFGVRRIEAPVGSTSHGDFNLAEVDGASPESIARLARDPSLGDIDLRRAVFLDTETTGLSGGAGVYVYMVGLGWFEGDRYVSWQGFLRGPEEERAMLAEVAEIVGSHESLVSFFGKSFDRHRLEDKMRIVGVLPPFEGRPHLDLYHPLRRLTRGAFPNGKLQTMERELLGFHRAHDLPGQYAPAAWFDYLAGRSHLLDGVFEHNREDVLSLCVLAAFLGRVECETRQGGEALPGPPAERARALMETEGDPVQRLRWANLALQRGLDGESRRDVEVVRAHLLRRSGDVEAARAAYRSALERCDSDAAAIELFVGASMLLERGLRDRDNALAMARRAQSLARTHGRPAGVTGKLEQRVARLERECEG